jgi:hypothetical protein
MEELACGRADGNVHLVKSRRADPVMAANLRRRHSSLSPPQYPDNSLVTEVAALHSSVSLENGLCSILVACQGSASGNLVIGVGKNKAETVMILSSEAAGSAKS